MLGRLAAFTDRVRHSALAIPAAVALAALMLGISESAYRGAQNGLERLAEMGQARVLMLQTMQRLSAAESGKRGYLLAGGDEYLLPYRTAHDDARRSLAEMERLFQEYGDREAEQLRQRIARLVNSKLSEMEEVLRLQQEGKSEAALDVVRSGIGRDLMEQLLKEGRELLAYQNQRIVEGRRNVYDTLQLNRIGVATMTAVSLLVLIMLVRQGRLLDQQRRERESEVKSERDRLEREVMNRTAELTELTRHLQTAREDERARLARDLHDELGALLTAAKLDVARIKPKLLSAAPDLMPRLTHLTESLNSGIALKRRIIEDLRPSTLSSLGLVPALEILCTEFGERSGIRVDAELRPVRLTPSAELTVFRLVQEALTNVAKYAQASVVTLTLGSSDGQAQVTVRDNGVGFEAGAARRGSHGLLGMRFRVEAEQGQFQLQSQPGQGTSVSAEIPEPPAAAPAAAQGQAAQV